VSTSLLTELQRRGIRLSPEGGMLRVQAPSGELTEEDRCAIRDAKLALLAALKTETAADAAVGWRVAAMAPQVPTRGPVPFLTVGLSVGAGACPSCGGDLGDTHYRCRPCSMAAARVLTHDAGLPHPGLAGGRDAARPCDGVSDSVSTRSVDTS